MEVCPLYGLSYNVFLLNTFIISGLKLTLYTNESVICFYKATFTMYCTVDEPSKMTQNDVLHICYGASSVGSVKYKDGKCIHDTRLDKYPISCPDNKETKSKGIRKFKVLIREMAKTDVGEWSCMLNSTGTVSNVLNIAIRCK